MALTPKGKSKRVQNTTPVINLKTLGTDSTIKVDTNVTFVPLFQYNTEDEGITLTDGYDIAETMMDIFQFTFALPNPEKPGDQMFRSVSWRSSGLQVADGDICDDPGFAIGLDLSQDERKNTPGFHGAPGGNKAMWDNYNTSIRVPVIWQVETNKKGEVVPGTGELAWLELNSSQFLTMKATMTTIIGEVTQKPVSHSDDNNPLSYEDRGNRGYAISFHKRPKASMRDINTFSCSQQVVADSDYERFDSIVLNEYPKMIQGLNKRFFWYEDILNQVINEEIPYQDGCLAIHASIARRFLASIGSIPQDSAYTDEEINTLWSKKLSTLDQRLTSTNSSAAVKETTTVEVSVDLDNEVELPF